jgi:hypothetical protein
VIIRTEQMKALERVSELAFEVRTYAHLQKWFPRHCEIVGEDQMHEVIRFGLKKANGHDLTAECCVRSYIEFMCLLGSGFDSDTLLAWAAVILSDRSNTDQVKRGDLLYAKVWDYFDHLKVDMQDGARLLDAWQQLGFVGNEILTPAAMPKFIESLHGRLQRMFPAKCTYVGDQSVKFAINSSVQDAAAYGINFERGAMLFSGMRFVLGESFHEDPLLPWVSATLRDPAVADPQKKVDRLYEEGTSFLMRWSKLASAGKGPAAEGSKDGQR